MATETKLVHRPANADSYPPSWSWHRLDDVCDGVVDCPHTTPVLTDCGPFVVRSQDIRSGIFRSEAAACVSESTYGQRIARAEPTHGDLLYSREGTYFGIAAEVPKGVRVCLGQRMVLIRPRSSVVDFRYLKYWLNSPTIVAFIGGFRDGSVAERLNLPTIRALPVIVPPLAHQRRIADVLGALDDRIELNRCVSRTLDCIVSAIFRSWFIDFDPVHNKMKGGRLGLPPVLAALFPESMSGASEAEHPEGWKWGRMGQLANERSERVGTSNDAVVLSAVSSGHLVRSDEHFTKRVYSKDVGQYKVVLKNDFAYNPSRINIGSVGLLHDDVVGAVSPVYVVFSPKPGYQHFIDFYLRQATTRHWIAQLSSGSVRQSLSYRDLASIPVIIPSGKVVAAFNALVVKMRLTVSALRAESSTLAALRDELLRKLTGGQVGLDATGRSTP